MALRAAKQLYPQLEISFLARERFSAAACRVPWIKAVIPLSTDALLGPVLSGEKNEVEALADIASWAEPWDMIINWSYSEASSYLTGLLPGRVKLGYTRRSDGSFYGADGWSHYIQAIIQGGVSQDIHLTDILTTQLLTALQIHLGEPFPNGNAQVTSKTFFNLILSESQSLLDQMDPLRKWITIQIGCGQESKTWDVKNWVKLALWVLGRNPEHGIVVLGGKEDRVKSEAFLQEFSATAPSLVSSLLVWVGETSFDLWASAISKSQWLFSCDTAAIHLASVLGTRVLNVSVGPVRFSETGPYGNGHYVVTSGLACEACLSASIQTQHTCRENVSPEAVYGVWAYASREWSHFRQIPLEKYFSQLGWARHLESVLVFRSRIRNSHDGGGVVYDPVNKQEASMRDWTAKVMGHIARFWYCGWTPPVGQELKRESINPLLVQQLRSLQESTEVLSKIFLQAEKTASQLNRKGSSLKSENIMGVGDREELQHLGNALADLEDLIERVVKTHPPLLGFFHMQKVLMHNLRGTHVAELGKESASNYRQLYEGVQIYKDWVEFTLKLVKPVAVKPKNPLLECHSKFPGKDLLP